MRLFSAHDGYAAKAGAATGGKMAHFKPSEAPRSARTFLRPLYFQVARRYHKRRGACTGVETNRLPALSYRNKAACAIKLLIRRGDGSEIARVL